MIYEHTKTEFSEAHPCVDLQEDRIITWLGPIRQNRTYEQFCDIPNHEISYPCVKVPEDFADTVRRFMEESDVRMDDEPRFSFGEQKFRIRFISDCVVILSVRGNSKITEVPIVEIARKCSLKSGIGIAEVLYEQFLIDFLHKG